MMNPEMMKMAQEMMQKMSPEDMQRMMEMQKNMDPSMMAQAQQMMSNPAMQQQAAAAMKNMTPDQMKAQMDAAQAKLNGPGGALPRPTAAAPAKSCLEKLKASVMSVDEAILASVEQAEGSKATGNTKFKAGDHAAAAEAYQHGAGLLAEPLGKLSGGDAAAVRELKHACHTNCANCLLKLERWEAAVAECDVVLGHGPNRKALFRRAQALEKLDQDEEARAGFQQALKMEEDATVRACLVALEARMGVDDEPDAASEAAPAAAARAPAAPMMPRPGMPGMPGMGPNGMPDPVAMEKMLDQITPEQMAQQAEMLENMDEAQLKAMAPQLGGMDPSMMKGMAVRDAAQFFAAIFSARNLRRNSLTCHPAHLASQGMMKNMDPQMMKNMTRMAQQMGGVPGMGGGGGGGGGAGPSGAGGMPDMANMDMSNAAEMMGKMNPDMMKAGMEMMKGMVRRYRAIRRNLSAQLCALLWQFGAVL